MSDPGPTDADYLWLTETWAGALFEISAGDEHVDVPCCPGWQLRHPVHHMGNVASFVDAVIEAVGPEAEFTGAELRGDAEVCDRAGEQTSALLHRLRTLDPQTRVWNWSKKPARLRFWPRCLAHESLVRADEGARWHRAIENGEVRAVDTDLDPDVLLHGRGEQLYLGLWGRVPLTGTRGTEARIAALRTG
ncbi:maleylpyruvate isomerase N-terminal domain-containing protein [Sciscionella marina]|uniref:maleylpyruvate isomerase N-terminal domain-containing protein n=1 Tax=Sciscionella marina TaxID=508770 RepID=UPI0003687723|nr:maleylpyruvate isomerase N-terminal domain-containing protein [Sciscionella marina]